jgi:DNA polymerase-3 subunit epsilon
VHGLTAAMLTGQPHYADVAARLAPLLRGRILVAHNAAFDYAVLAAETRRCGAALPVTDVLCTHELASRLDLGLHSLSLAALDHPASPPFLKSLQQ